MKTMFALAAIALVTAPALANAPKTGGWKVGNDSYHIYYADLDMHSTDGRAQLLTRVQAYAARLCDAPVKAEEQACVADMVAHLPNPDIQHALAEQTQTQLAAR